MRHPGRSSPKSCGFRRRVLRGYEALKARDPARLDGIRARVYRYEDKLRGAGLDPWDVPVGRFSTGGILIGIGFFLLRFALLLPLGLPGLILHYLPYRLVGFLSRRAVGKYDDILATAKAVSAFVVFPLTWTAVAILFWQGLGTAAGLIALVLAALRGYAALRLAELADRATAPWGARLWILGRGVFCTCKWSGGFCARTFCDRGGAWRVIKGGIREGAGSRRPGARSIHPQQVVG